jgi:predicted transcriptional regulator of viral defense system
MAERRQPGEVRDAIVAALRQRHGTATVEEIVQDVEARLGGPVARSSVRSYLQNEGRFERLERGRYRLRG